MYIRIWRLYKYVDYFVILVSNTTFSGIKRNITFSPYEKELEQDKIGIISLPHQLGNRYIYPSQFFNKIWCFEKTSRDYTLQAIRSLFGLKMSDLIFVSDLDEIFTREAMEYIIQNPLETYYYARGYMYFPYYYHIIENWNYRLMLRYDPKYFALSRFRSKYPFYPVVPDDKRAFITHCSYCFKNIDDYMNKFKSFPHQEFNRPTFYNL